MDEAVLKNDNINGHIQVYVALNICVVTYLLLLFRPKPSCFNCGGEHILSECQEPKDFQRIKKNKSEFLDKSSQNQKLTGYVQEHFIMYVNLFTFKIFYGSGAKKLHNELMIWIN